MVEHHCTEEGVHVDNCKCTYGTDLENNHTLLHLDDRCRDLYWSHMRQNLDNVEKSFKWYPMYMRSSKTPNAQDKLKEACWNLSDKQILQIVSYIKDTYKT